MKSFIAVLFCMFASVVLALPNNSDASPWEAELLPLWPGPSISDLEPDKMGPWHGLDDHEPTPFPGDIPETIESNAPVFPGDIPRTIESGGGISFSDSEPKKMWPGDGIADINPSEQRLEKRHIYE